jgi:hypothetical protein
MTYTVEDTLEILAGLRPRMLNIRLDYADRNLIRSIGKQVQTGMALTDRQLDLILKKIEKYREGLTKNSIDVDRILTNKTLRMPLREIDRSQRVYVDPNSDVKDPQLVVKHSYSKKFTEIWQDLSKNVVGKVTEKSMIKEMPATETNILHVVGTLQKEGFDIEEQVLEYHEKLEKILENPTDFAPHADFVNGAVTLKNANRRCIEHADHNISEEVKKNVLIYVNRLKNYGIYYKTPALVEKIEEISQDPLIKQVVLNTGSRFRVDPEKYSLDTLADLVNKLDQWPILVVVDDSDKAFEQVSSFYYAVAPYVSDREITVFFRLDKTQKNFNEFNHFVRDKGLNNFIGPESKIVFIEKNKIPKPLIKADWHPTTAVVMSAHDYGKTSSFLDDFLTVYYYNNSGMMRNNRIKGAREIAQL